MGLLRNSTTSRISSVIFPFNTKYPTYRLSFQLFLGRPFVKLLYLIGSTCFIILIQWILQCNQQGNQVSLSRRSRRFHQYIVLINSWPMCYIFPVSNSRWCLWTYNEQLFVFRQIDLPLVTLRRLIEQPAVSSPIRLRTFVADRVALCHVHSRLKATSARNPVLVKIKTMPFS